MGTTVMDFGYSVDLCMGKKIIHIRLSEGLAMLYPLK